MSGKYYLIEIHPNGFSQFEITKKGNSFYHRSGIKVEKNPINLYEEITKHPKTAEELRKMVKDINAG